MSLSHSLTLEHLKKWQKHQSDIQVEMRTAKQKQTDRENEIKSLLASESKEQIHSEDKASSKILIFYSNDYSYALTN